jgi:hypothetical protein
MSQIIFEQDNIIPKHKPEEYLYIKAWNKMIGTLNYYTKIEQKKASQANAPLNATFFSHEKRWHTPDDIPDELMKDMLFKIVQELEQNDNKN